MTRKVLLSTDIGSDIDDAIALHILLRQKQVDLRAVYTVNGNLNARSSITREMVRLAEKSGEIVVADGLSKPLIDKVDPYRSYEESLVTPRYYAVGNDLENGNLRYHPHEIRGVVQNGLEHLAGLLEQDSYEILSIGPLTTIAKLIRDKPEAKKNIKRIVQMGFRLNHGLEHNIRFDTAAASEICESGLPVLFLPGDVASQYQIPFELVKESLTSPLGHYLSTMIRKHLAYKTAEAIFVDDVDIGEKDPSKPWKNKPDLVRLKKILEILDPKQPLREIQTPESFLEIRDWKKAFVEVMDSRIDASHDPDCYFENYNKLIAHFRDPKYSYNFLGEHIAKRLEDLLVKDLPSADIMTIFAFLHPEHIKIKYGKVSVEDIEGRCSFDPLGVGHSVVEEVNIPEFEKFLLKYLK